VVRCRARARCGGALPCLCSLWWCIAMVMLVVVCRRARAHGAGASPCCCHGRGRGRGEVRGVGGCDGHGMARVFVGWGEVR
jgi:hypothetical protein